MLMKVPLTTPRRSPLARATTAFAAFALAACAGAGAESPSTTSATAPTTVTIPAKADSASIVLGASLGSNSVLAGSTSAYMAVTLTAPEFEARHNIDLALVLDTSASMEDWLPETIAAAGKLVGDLESGDRFSIVAYGSEVSVLVPGTEATATAKGEALKRMSEVLPEGGTNTSAAIVAARSQLLGLSALNASPSNDRVRRIVLLADGSANEGVVSPDDLSNLAAESATQGVSITTIGIGLLFDEETLARIAVKGRGNYYFAESADMLASVFTTELSRLTSTVATGVQLRISTKPAVDVVEILGYEMMELDGGVLVDVADMHAGETRKLVIAVEVESSERRSMPIADIDASFVALGSGKTGKLRRTVNADISADQAVVDGGRNLDAFRHIERARTGQAIAKASSYSYSGDPIADINAREAEVQAATAKLSGAMEFAKEMQQTHQQAKGNFSPPPSIGRGKTSKRNHRDAYKLLR